MYLHTPYCLIGNRKLQMGLSWDCWFEHSRVFFGKICRTQSSSTITPNSASQEQINHRPECAQNPGLISAVQAHPCIKPKVLVCCSTEGQHSWGSQVPEQDCISAWEFPQTQRLSGTKVLWPDKTPGCKFVFDRITTFSTEVNGDLQVEIWHKGTFSGGRGRPASQLVSSPLS